MKLSIIITALLLTTTTHAKENNAYLNHLINKCSEFSKAHKSYNEKICSSTAQAINELVNAGSRSTPLQRSIGLYCLKMALGSITNKGKPVPVPAMSQACIRGSMKTVTILIKEGVFNNLDSESLKIIIPN